MLTFAVIQSHIDTAAMFPNILQNGGCYRGWHTLLSTYSGGFMS